MRYSQFVQNVLNYEIFKTPTVKTVQVFY